MTETQFWTAELLNQGIIVGVLVAIGVALWKIGKNQKNWLHDWFKRKD